MPLPVTTCLLLVAVLVTFAISPPAGVVIAVAATLLEFVLRSDI